MTRDGAYFTDSQVQQIYKVPIGRDGSLGELGRIPITGDFVYTTGFNANGIAATRDGRTLVIVKGNDGRLFTADAATGATREIALDRPVTSGDGLLLDDKRLWVVQNQLNQVVEVKLDRDFSAGRSRPGVDGPAARHPDDDRAVRQVAVRRQRPLQPPDTSPDDIVRLNPRGHGHKRGHKHHRHHR